MTTKKKEEKDQETERMSLHKCLAHIQANLKTPKGQRNEFGNYNYRSCEDILAALKPLLAETGASLSLEDEIVAVLDRVYVKATASLGIGERVIKNSAFAREPLSRKGMDESQITGAASSYARKYALAGLFAIDSGVPDADTKDNTDTEVLPEPVGIDHRFQKGEREEIVRQCLDCLDRDDSMELSKILSEASQDENKIEQPEIRAKVAGLFTPAQRTMIKQRLNEIRPPIPLNGE